MENLIKQINNLRPTKKQVKDKPAYYAFGYVDAINSMIELVKNNAVSPHVISSLPSREIEKQVLEDYLDWCRNKYPGKQTIITEKMINDFVNGQ